MRGNTSALIKKELSHEFYFLRAKKRPDILGIVLSLFLAAIFVGAVAFMFYKFIPVYTAVPYNFVVDKTARQYEILTVVYTAVLLTGVISAVRNINNGLFENEDIKVLVYLPVKPAALLFSKLIGAYLKSLFTTIVIVVPVNITFGIIVGSPYHYGLMTALICLLLPLINISLATVFALPAYYIKRLLGGHYLISLLLLVAVLSGLLYAYSTILTSLKYMLENRELSMFFNHEIMTLIITAVKYMYPANLVADMLLARNMLFSGLMLLGIIVAAVLLGLLISRALLIGAMQQRFQSGIRFVYRKKRHSKKSASVFAALLKKEFVSVFRSQSYAFQYFATAIIMPLMVYFSLSLLISLVKNLVFVDCSFELCVFVIMIFAVLTNTFCATNISREGNMFYAAKCMPVTHRQIVFAKLLFCSVVSTVSLAACAVMIGLLGYVLAWQAVVIFFVTLCVSLGQIAFATRMDFNRPHFSNADDGEIRESNSTVSTMIVLGLLFAIAIGGLSLYLSLFLKLRNSAFGSAVSYLIVSLCALAALGLGIFYLLYGLKKKYYNHEK
jgi:ABC-2 type transport system permease protein